MLSPFFYIDRTQSMTLFASSSRSSYHHGYEEWAVAPQTTEVPQKRITSSALNVEFHVE